MYPFESAFEFLLNRRGFTNPVEFENMMGLVVLLRLAFREMDTAGNPLIVDSSISFFRLQLLNGEDAGDGIGEWSFHLLQLLDNGK